MIDDITESNRAVNLLLQLCSIASGQEEKEPVIREAESFSNWKLFTDLAVRHGVAALVWQNMSDLSLTKPVPEPERTILEGSRLRSITRVAYITSVAGDVVSILGKEGIRVLLLKGLALEHQIYGSRGLRQMSDADLLVAPEEALRARDILIREGFVSMPMKSKLYRHIILDLGNHLPELHRGGVSVDLHHRLFGPEGATMISHAIKNAAVLSVEGNTFHVLPPAIAFLGLVNHIYKHGVKGEFQLRLYNDIGLLLKKYGSEILNKDLMSSSAQAGIENEVREVLSVVSGAWGIQVPHEMRLSPEQEKEAVKTFIQRILHPGLVKPVSQREFFRRNLKSIRGVRKKLIFIAGDLFPSVGFMKRRYGCRTTMQALLYYPHRFGKISWILGKNTARGKSK
jgi:hypothetical protein